MDNKYSERKEFEMFKNIKDTIDESSKFTVILILGIGLLVTLGVLVYLKLILEPLEILI